GPRGALTACLMHDDGAGTRGERLACLPVSLWHSAAPSAGPRGQRRCSGSDIVYRRGRVPFLVRRRHDVRPRGRRSREGEGTAAEAATSIGLAVGRGDAAAVEGHGDGGERRVAGAVYRDAAAHRAFARGHAEAWGDREGACTGVLRTVRRRHGAEPSGL